MVRALITDDSRFMREVLRNILEKGGVEVVGTAENGVEAVSKVDECNPDVVTMDLEMPVMGGIEAIEKIMDRHPTPILVLSSHSTKNAELTMEALDRGAIDFFVKPGGDKSIEISKLSKELVEKVKAVANTKPLGSFSIEGTASVEDHEKITGETTLIIGASTGGPKCVETILSSLPLEAGLRILVVQHMSSPFTKQFAERLDRSSEYDVWECRDRDRVSVGEAVVARGGSHLKVVSYTDGVIGVKLTGDPPVNSIRPAIDVTMESAARKIDGGLVGTLLTGMGRDGVDGARAIKSVGGSIIVQDEATSQVFGIPKRAIEAGVVDRVLPITDIPRSIVDVVSGGPS
ncbi:chemotaxis-specific protein-glutamate methyltransferase CheB [Methanonatronarchaeum sp. AMET6-2]|uniref:chemotaxis-specific protein-glutamate methyltransferase CheB n=1 Tax=Methanonatronarchaeum sp. AMET6-2 TaxID=2933293 RepID=UPI001213D874|nr:chemotaxis-specific protein-glutamate methyltransferase CheB [Methanonatronarchaeum sp. AMET6-2]RZN61667.1 MAG: chemotaxis-specific protein-glutamate methyltransferase CheB [Methanonatronarchaeia archaeon]UOY10160.1 chemotaxis-specific protein-glutamate methyltransferase CheB [Methanonatronarchaeum sp. AMET6-2]